MNTEKGKKQSVLACISCSADSMKLIRTAWQLAKAYQAEFTVIHAESKSMSRLSKADQNQLKKNMDYAKSLGAETEIFENCSPAKKTAEYAHSNHVTKIVVGRSDPKRSFAYFRNTFLRRLKSQNPDADIVTIPKPLPEYDPKYRDSPLKVSWKDIAIMIGILTVATLICEWFQNLGFTDATLITVYILAVLLVSFLTTGFVCSIAASILSVTVFNYLFTVPFFSLRSYGAGYPVTLFVMFLSAFLTSSLTAQVKRQAQEHAQNAYRTEMLLNANRRLQLAHNETEILQETACQIQKLLLRSVVLYPVHSKTIAEPLIQAAGEKEEELSKKASRDEERRIACWVAENNTQCGATTGLFSQSSFWYLAVRMNKRDSVCAVAAIEVGQNEQIDAFDKNLLLAMLGECAVAIEKERLNQTNAEFAIRMKQERLRSDLLRSISHDLRTPLTTISGNASILLQDRIMDEKERHKIYTDIYDDSVWLNGLVENLLSITRMDDGSLQIHREAVDLSDVMDAAAAHAGPVDENQTIEIEKSSFLALVSGDSSLLVQMIVNLLNNALKYAGDHAHIKMSAVKEEDHILISVADDGPGIEDKDKEKVFEMFYTAQKHSTPDGRRGLGLGLALCRAIAQAHQGSIQVRDNVPHGAVFEVRLPKLEESI